VPPTAVALWLVTVGTRSVDLTIDLMIDLMIDLLVWTC
jgi:hypothetical protein